MAGPSPNFVAIQKELESISTMYSEKPSTTTTNFFITGESGSGKTVLISTAPGPILIDSFDPRGSESISDQIRAGRVIVDTRWEQDDPRTPFVFAAWEKSFWERKKSGMFDVIGTYAIDSSTGMLSCIMNMVLKREGRPAGVPQQNDYLPQMTFFQNVMQTVASLPCNVIVTNHLNLIEDASKGDKTVLYRPLITGKLNVRTPLLFSEIYVLDTKQTSKGIERTILTQSTGRYLARTRIGREVFDLHEVPNLSQLLKKAGKAYEDKQISTMGKEEK